MSWLGTWRWAAPAPAGGRGLKATVLRSRSRRMGRLAFSRAAVSSGSTWGWEKEDLVLRISGSLTVRFLMEYGLARPSLLPAKAFGRHFYLSYRIQYSTDPVWHSRLYDHQTKMLKSLYLVTYGDSETQNRSTIPLRSQSSLHLNVWLQGSPSDHQECHSPASLMLVSSTICAVTFPA